MVVAERYAKALLNLSVEKNQLESVLQDVQLVLNYFRASSELFVIMNNPVIRVDKKQKILLTLFDKKISELSKSFLLLIINRKRSGIIPAICEAFINLYKIKEKILDVTITSAVPLDNNLKEEIINKTVRKLEDVKKIEVTEEVNPDIIGGFIVKWGSSQVDQSIRTQLQKFKKNLQQTTITFN